MANLPPLDKPMIDHPNDDLAGYIQRFIFPAAYFMLPAKMASPDADAFLLAIGLQESRFRYRRQAFGGPARGFWQFESGGGVRGVLTHRTSAPYALGACNWLLYRTKLNDGTLAEKEIHTALEHNDTLATVFARLLLWTLPDALPGRGQPEIAWGQYLEAWRPGKPRRDSWNAHYARAWSLVEP